jgi:acetyl esterase/lipase
VRCCSPGAPRCHNFLGCFQQSVDAGALNSSKTLINIGNLLNTHTAQHASLIFPSASGSCWHQPYNHHLSRSAAVSFVNMDSSTAADAPAPPHVVEDCRGAAVRVFSDGTVVRSDAPIAPRRPVRRVEGRRLRRRARPAPPRDQARRRRRRLPVVVYFHGGGYCIGSFAGLDAFVVALEHRLPAAADPWLAAHADFSRIFVTGESAGGNLVHHMSVRFSGAAAALLPVRLRGFVPLTPFFAGVEPTPSELSCPDDAFFSREAGARYIRLCLPAGATADHPYLNPCSPDAPTLVVVAGDDSLRDRNVEYVRRLEAMGKPVELVEFPGQGHGFFMLQPWSKAVDELIRAFKLFMGKACSN